MQKLIKATRNKRSNDCILQIITKLEAQYKKFWLPSYKSKQILTDV